MQEELSKRIKEIRKLKNITLKELSEKTSLSPSFLSQVERGVSSMTITSVKKIADALEIPLSELVKVSDDTNGENKLQDSPESKNASTIESRFIHRATQNPSLLGLRREYIDYERLSGFFPGRKLEILMLEMEPNVNDSEELVHEGEEFYYVLEGTADFIIENELCVLTAGESIHFPSNIPHRILNRHDKKLKMISIVTPVYF